MLKLIVLLFGISVSLYGNYPFEIAADKLNYQNETGILNASGNVVINYKTYEMKSDKVYSR